MSARRLITLIEGLPEGSRTFGGGGWLIEHEMAALSLESFIKVHSKKDAKPFRIPRPGRETKQDKPRRQLSMADQIQFVVSQAMDRKKGGAGG